MAAYQVSRSITISAPIKTIRTSLIDFTQWPAWSPWLIIEPTATLEYSDSQSEVGANYNWEGQLIGAGSMQIETLEDSKIEIKTTFIRPFKSKADVSFEFESIGDETKVTWNMSGKVPFFLIPMLKKIKAYVGMDYERGLRLLKEYIETGSLSSSITIDGVTHHPAIKYIGIENECKLTDIGKVMPTSFQTLAKFIQEKNGSMGAVFAIYNEFDLVGQHASFISAIAIDRDIEVEAPFIMGELEESECVKVTHTGPYPHIGNGWAAAMGYARAKEIKTTKSPIGIEYYLNDPVNTPTNELITAVILPIK
ncbi:MAG: GyrI-like domain-containing protein [Cocleimonas sp.]|nr:GyrI-like domain-containing protein [Cocleimonas sp.]